MSERKIPKLEHKHLFGMNEIPEGERKATWVIWLTLTMMTVEIIGGIAFGSMALLADGWHMGSHAVALGITVFAYMYGRKNSDNPRYSFGTGKVRALGGFSSAILLLLVACFMVFESVKRMISPVPILFNAAIGVAITGFVINLFSAKLLQHEEHPEHPDTNLKGAYLHVLADTLTSVLAIFALLVGKYFGWIWMDPIIGILGAIVIFLWSWGLLKESSQSLLDAEISKEQITEIQTYLEEKGECKVVDIHVWRVGPQHLSIIVSLLTEKAQPPQYYKTLLSHFPDLAHMSIEVNTSITS